MKKCFVKQCNNLTDIRCIRCKRAYYCSKECQSNAWNLHKYVCFPSISDCLLGILKIPHCKFYNLYGIYAFHIGCISYNIDYEKEITILSYSVEEKYPASSYYKALCCCIFCERRILFIPPVGIGTYHYQLWNGVRVFFKRFEDEKPICVYKCIDCLYEKKNICPITFMDDNLCTLYKFTCLSIFLNKNTYFVIPEEIMNMIKRFFILSRCCIHYDYDTIKNINELKDKEEYFERFIAYQTYNIDLNSDEQFINGVCIGYISPITEIYNDKWGYCLHKIQTQKNYSKKLDDLMYGDYGDKNRVDKYKGIHYSFITDRTFLINGDTIPICIRFTTNDELNKIKEGIESGLLVTSNELYNDIHYERLIDQHIQQGLYI